MEKKRAKAVRVLVYLYIVFLVAGLPLYMYDGLVLIGDMKYLYFLYLTGAFLALGVAGSLLQGKPLCCKISVTDGFVLAYAVSQLLSTICAGNQRLALWGYPDWHMGLVSQGMLVGSYFMVSRWCISGKPDRTAGEAAKHRLSLHRDFCGELPWIAAGMASMAVYLVAVANRYGYDPLGVFQGMQIWDWNRSHLLSTIGNINWYCCYVCVTACISFYYGCRGKGILRLAGLLGSFITFLTILTQGSESIYPVLVAWWVILLLLSTDNRRNLCTCLETLVLLPLAALFTENTLSQFSRERLLIEDGYVKDILNWKGWIPMLIILALAILWLELRQRQTRTDRLQNGKIQRYLLWVTGICCVIAAVVLVLCRVNENFWHLMGERSWLRIDDSWGNGRGAIWRLALECFQSSSVQQKLVGYGPDCFTDAIYFNPLMTEAVYGEGQWAGGMFANAHNEWLTMLINGGLLSLFTYLGIFGSSLYRMLRRYRQEERMLLGILLVAGYAVGACFTFQQAVSTPIFFVLLGASEVWMRRQVKK